MNINTFLKNFDLSFKETFTNNLIDEIVNSLIDSKSKFQNLELKNDFGIYVFFYKNQNAFNSFDELQTIWNSEDFKKTPKAIKKNFESCYLNNGYYCFYVGKSEKLKTRVKEHLEHSKDKATYGLKLNERKKFNLDDYEIGYWYLDSEDNSKYSKILKQFIITTLEEKVRNKLKPLIGKK